MTKILMLFTILLSTLVAQAQIPDADIVNNEGNTVGSIHFHNPAPAPTPSDFQTHDQAYWMKYYGQMAFQAEILARLDAPALQAQQVRRDAQERAIMRRDA